MALRFTVQADTQQECAQGLKELCARLGLEPAMPPQQMIGNGWMARAVPKQKAPTAESGRGPAVSG
ncbi:hypothetical protein ACFY2M_19320 [Streptomyces sp. NPDC001276]|uniref:hypothetical protein n=1 Tax=Streptomyces sp. NPDC001276 TaxID=3364555 RepID=UPI0036C295F2